MNLSAYGCGQISVGNSEQMFLRMILKHWKSICERNGDKISSGTGLIQFTNELENQFLESGLKQLQM